MGNLEMMVIGEIVFGGWENKEAQEALLRLEGAHFLNHEARKVFEEIKRRFSANKPFDTGIMLSELQGNAFTYCAEAVNDAYTTSSLSHNTDRLLSRKIRREGEAKIKELQQEIKNETMDSVACEKIMELGIELTKLDGVQEKVIYTGEEFGDMFLENSSPHEFKVPTGVHCIDSKMTEGGVRNRTLMTIAGRSSMGKTCFSMFMAHNLAKNHPAKRILFYSLEMSAVDILHKQVATSTQKPIANMTWSEKALGFRKSQEEAILVVYEKPMATIEYICTTARIASARTPIGVIVVDYIGITQSRGKFENQAIRLADVTAQLAGLAKELNCIVIALSQVNRECANRQDKRPLMSDAAESSGSERNSDTWLGIYRPSFDDDDPRLKGQFIVNCRKDRFGVPWEALLWFDCGVFREPPTRNW